VVSVYYQLAPEYPFPAAVEDIVAVYQELLKGHKPKEMGIFGTSAGAILTAEVAVALRQRGLPLPGALGIFSGTGDLSQPADSEALYTIHGFTGHLTPPSKGSLDTSYIGRTNPRDPVLSPLYADLHGLPRFPFDLIRQLRSRRFPVEKGRIFAARLGEDFEPDFASQLVAAGFRQLHAKWVALKGPRTALLLVGSANFTRSGMGTLRDPISANIEACALLKLPASEWDRAKWRPPIQGQEVDWASCSSDQLRAPADDKIRAPDWPEFISRLELTVCWDHLPEPDGALQIHLRSPRPSSLRIEVTAGNNVEEYNEILNAIDGATEGCLTASLSPMQTLAILARRTVLIVWDEDNKSAFFPVNISPESKAGMPSVLGAKPSEEQLLGYFHGRISDEDLLAQLEEQARRPDSGPPPVDVVRRRQLQNYLVREFVESLYGLEQALKESLFSPRAAEQAFLGDLSPMSLAEQIVQAFTSGARSPTATAFQLVELVRVLSCVALPEEQPGAHLAALQEVRERAMKRLFTFIAQLVKKKDFAAAATSHEFGAFVGATLKPELVERWREITAVRATSIALAEENRDSHVGQQVA